MRGRGASPPDGPAAPRAGHRGRAQDRRPCRGHRPRALVVAGAHEYGRQLDGQLRLAGLPRAERVRDADLVVLAGLAGEPEIERAAETASLPLIAFDGAQGAPLADREVCVAMPYAPADGVPNRDVLAGLQ